MGQRHQLYFRTWGEKDRKESTDRAIKPRWHCFHSQWCYGSMPLRLLKWVLEFESNADAYCKLSRKEITRDDIREVITQLISTNAADGYHQSVLVEDELMVKGIPDPNLGDNNDGITVLDLTGKRPKYAFVLLEDETGYAPLTGEQYAAGYYQKGSKDWKAFKIDSWHKYIQKHADLLTVEELAEFFPRAWNPILLERAEIRKDPKNIPVLLADGLVYKAANRAYAEDILKGRKA